MSNPNPLRKTRQVIRVATNLAIILVLSGVFILKERFDQANAMQHQRADAATVLGELSRSITAKLARIRIVSSSLSGAISLAPDIDQARFTDFTSKVSLNDTGITNIAALRGYEIALVYPFEENQALIGRRLTDVPEQFEAAQRAERTGQSVLQGPITLLQGGDGYILRDPVFLNRRYRSDFWGFVAVVFSAEQFFQDLGLEEVAPAYDVAITADGSGAAVFGDPALFDAAPMRESIEVPGGAWEIGLRPIAGWQGDFDRRSLLVFYLLSTALALAIANILFNQRRRALQASEQLQSAIDVLADGFVLYDADDQLVVCNQKYLDLYEASAPAIVPGATFEEILRYGLKRGQYPKAVGREEAWLAERLAAHRTADGTLEQQLEDGRWLRIREMPTPDGGRVGIRVDITEQVESRKRAEIAEGRLRDAINTVPAGFWLFDHEEKLELVNDRARRPFEQASRGIEVGDSLEDVVRRMVEMELPDASPAEVKLRRDLLLRQLRRNAAEFEIQTGPETWYKYFNQRTAEGGLVCFGIDISELVKHERWLQQSNEKLRAALAERDAAEMRFEDVADISTEWFWEQDAEGRLTYLSPGIEKSLGVNIADILGRDRIDLAIVDPDEPHDSAEELREKLAKREAFDGIIYRSNLKPETETWLRSSGKPIFDARGEFQGYRGTAADITPFYTALREARRADEAKTQFLNVISHELRTPMTIVLGFNAFLTKLDDLPELRHLRERIAGTGDATLPEALDATTAQVKRFAGKIQVAGEQLQGLINDMLDLARIEANTIRIDLVRVNAHEIVSSIIDQMQPMIEGKDVEVVIDVDDIELKSDAIRLRQILTNLLANAVKFTDTGQIAVRARRRDGMAVIDVADTGTGIPKEALGSIFERFTQADASDTRNQGGAGLGLAISKELIRLQGGTVQVASEVGQGTTVTFTLPLWADPQPGAATVDESATK